MKRRTVLVLCTGNSARSQMAEALLRKYAGDRMDVYSAGTDPAPAINPLTYKAMAEIGLDLKDHTVNGIKDYLGHLPVYTLIVVCSGAQKSCPSVWPGVFERIYWPFEDPAAAEGDEAARLAKFREVRDEIDRTVQGWAENQA